MSGKGDAPRNCYSDKFRDGWERAFASPATDGGDGKLTQEQTSEDGGSTPPASTSLSGQTSEK